MIQEGIGKMHISSPEVYPTQFTQQLPSELVKSARIAAIDSIVVCDFKSFKGQHYVGPFLNTTCIIGPNGSGKSNILDALLFCLSCEKVKGVNFDIRDFINKAASANKKTWVQAKLRLANGQEVTLKRELDSSGQSQFYVNYRPYDQKIYIQLLHSHGLLTDACNYGIFQHESDKLVSLTPESLRHYLQVLSGSLMLKESYDADRAELQKIASLIEADTSKVHRLRQEKRNLKQVKSSAGEYNRLTTRFTNIVETEIAAKMLIRETELRAINTEINKAQESEKSRIDEINKKKAQQQKNFREANEARAKLNSLMEVIGHLSGKLKQLSSRQEVYKMQQLQQFKQQLGRQNEQQSILTARLQYLDSNLPKLPSSQQASEYLALLDRWSRDNFMLKADFDKKLLNLASFDRTILSKQDALQRLKNIQKKNQTEEAGKHNKIQELNKFLESTRTKITQVKNSIREINDNNKKSVLTIESKEKDLQTIQQKLLDVENSILEGMEEVKLRDLFRKLMSIQGFKGQISDKIKPIHKKYAQCFSQIVGSFDSFLIAANEESANRIAQRLKDLRQVKNMVILQNVVQKQQSTQNHRRELGDLGTPAMDVVQFDKELSGLEAFLHYSLKNKVICNTLDDAFKLKQQRLKFVKEIYTLDGNVIRDDGMVSYSSTQKNKKKYNFDADVQKKLQSQMEQLQKKKSEVEEQLRVMKNNKTSAQLTALMNELMALEAKERQTISEIEYWKEYKGKKVENLQNYENELKQLKSKRQKLESNLSKAEKTVQSAEYFRQFMAKHNIGNLQSFRQANNLDQLQNNMRQKNKIQAQIDEINSQLILNRKKQLPRKIEKLENQLKQMQEAGYRVNLEQQLRLKQQQAKSIKQFISSVSVAEMPKFQSTLPELQEKKRLQQFQMKLYLKELNQSHGLNITDPDYQKPLQLLRQSRDSVSVEALQQLLDELEDDKKKVQEEIEKLNGFGFFIEGTDNQMKDVEAKIKDIEDRLEININKKEDVKTRLHETAEKRTKIFLDFVDKIKPLLSEFYRMLTETADVRVYGTAELSIQNMQNIFNSGVYFFTKPPSKRYMLDADNLSGGQKTIASIALQFSAAVATNSPFILFDECDAFLDASNVDRYLRLILKGHSEFRKQFIVISHKESVYESGNSLVGACCKKETSRIFSLRLDE